MPTESVLEAVLLGLVEGLTEFIPVSSTGHLILLVDILNFAGPPGKVFEVVIQLGAILAVCVVYFDRLWTVTSTLHRCAESRRFAAALLIAFLPAAVIGATLHGFIKEVLFNPTVVCVALIVGGVIILVVDRVLPAPRHDRIEAFSPLLALKIGFFQCIAMIPGVSRSGATIIGAMLMGVERKTAAEFSFFLAIPTMLGAAVYDLYKNREHLTTEGGLLIAVGFVTAFFAAALVVRALITFIGRHGVTPFGWYRIALGITMLAFLYL